MTEIIHPTFERRKIHKIRLVKANPNLVNHPEFQDVKPHGSPVALLAGLGFLVALAMLRRR